MSMSLPRHGRDTALSHWHVLPRMLQLALHGAADENNRKSSDLLRPQNTYPSELVWLFVTLLVLLLAGRALYVVPFALIHNAWSPEQLSARDIVVVW